MFRGNSCYFFIKLQIPETDAVFKISYFGYFRFVGFENKNKLMSVNIQLTSSNGLRSNHICHRYIF